MTAEPQTFDISEIPDLARAVAAARAAGRRLRLVERGEPVAELVPSAAVEHGTNVDQLAAGSATRPRARRKTGLLREDDALFRLIGIGDSGVAKGRDLAQPAAAAKRDIRRRTRESVVEQTAGALNRYRRIPPLTVEQEKEEFARAVAEENGPDRTA